MTTVYIDRVFLLNFLADDLLLLTTACLAGIPMRRGRLALCAAGGAIYAVAVFFPVGQVLAHPLIRAAVGVGMGLCAFWPQPRRARLVALFLLLSAGMGGFLLALGLAAGAPGQFLGHVYRAEIHWPVFIGATVLFYVLLRVLFRQSARHGGGEIMKVTVSIGEKKRTVLALRDTGNTLCDPVNGNPVLVLEQAVLYDLWPPEVTQIVCRGIPPEEKMVELHRRRLGAPFCLLPFRSVGVSAGLLLAYRSDRITVGRKVHRRALLALSEGPLSDGGAYHALWGGEGGSFDEGDHSQTSTVDTPVEQTV